MSSDDENTPPPPARDPLGEIKAAMSRLASAVLKVHYSQVATNRIAERNEKSLERVERKVGENGEKLAVLLKEADDTQKDVADLRDDISQPIPLQNIAHDPQLDIGPAKMPLSMWRRVFPYLAGGLVVLCVVGLLALVGIVYVSTHGH